MSDDIGAPRPRPGPPERSKPAKAVDYGMVAIVFVALGFAAFMQFGQPDPAEGFVGTQAPKFNLKTLAGDVVGLDQHQDKVVILDFWATWCNPCRQQMPYLDEIEDDARLADEVEIISINTDDPSPHRREAVRRFLGSGGWDWDPLIDNGQVMRLYRVRAFPTIVVIGKDGTVHHAKSGVHSTSTLRELIEEAGDS